VSTGKRLSTDRPLTEHDVAERLDRAALRVLHILVDARQLGLMEEVKQSRYHTNSLNALAAELGTWGVQPVPLRGEPHTAGPGR
jgi:hypothetical protein